MNFLLRPFLAINNAFVRRLLQSPFHRLLSGNVVLLSVIGRKSGRTYLVPVNYKLMPGGISVLTYRRRLWWRNLWGVDEVKARFRGSWVMMSPELVADDLEAIGQGLVERGWVRRSMFRAKAKESVLIRLRFKDGLQAE